MRVKIVHPKCVRIKDKQSTKVTVIIKYNLKLNSGIGEVSEIIEVTLKGIRNFNGNGSPRSRITLRLKVFVHGSHKVGRGANPIIKGQLALLGYVERSIGKSQLAIGNYKG